MSFLLHYHTNTCTHMHLLQTWSNAHRLANSSTVSDSTLHLSTTNISVNNRNGLFLLLLAAWSKPASRSRHPPRHIHKHGSHRTSVLSLQHSALRTLVSGPYGHGLSGNSDTSASGQLLLSCVSVSSNMLHNFVLLMK